MLATCLILGPHFCQSLNSSSVGESFSREVVSESPEASRDRHLDRQRPLAKSFESRERPLATGIYVAGGLRQLV